MDRLSPEQQFVYDSILQGEEDDQYRLGYAEQRGKEEGKHETSLAIAKKDTMVVIVSFSSESCFRN